MSAAPSDDLAARISQLRTLEGEAGRTDPLTICFVPFGLRMDDRTPIDFAALREQIEALGRLGVDWVSLGLQGETRSEALENLAEMAGELIAKPSA